MITIGVCFLHAYANPAHEERMRGILAEEHPDAVVSVSHEVLREYREYERAMTTLVDAAVKVRVAAYVTRLRRELTTFAGGDQRDPAAGGDQRDPAAGGDQRDPAAGGDHRSTAAGPRCRSTS